MLELLWSTSSKASTKYVHHFLKIYRYLRLATHPAFCLPVILHLNKELHSVVKADILAEVLNKLSVETISEDHFEEDDEGEDYFEVVFQQQCCAMDVMTTNKRNKIFYDFVLNFNRIVS